MPIVRSRKELNPDMEGRSVGVGPRVLLCHGVPWYRKALHERQAHLDLEFARLKEQLGNDRGTRSCGALTIANWLSSMVLY